MKKFVICLLLNLCLFGIFANSTVVKESSFGKAVVTEEENYYYTIYIYANEYEPFGPGTEVFISATTDNYKDTLISLNEWWKLLSMEDNREYTLERMRNESKNAWIIGDIIFWGND